MSDIRMVWSSAGCGDLELDSNDLSLDEGLESAVYVSLFTRQRADASDPLPSVDSDRAGWWGDVVRPIVEGDRIGSKLWLLSREKQLPIVLARAKQSVTEALRWLLDDHVAAAVSVETEFTRDQLLGIRVVITRPDHTTADFRYAYNWTAQAARVGAA